MQTLRRRNQYQRGAVYDYCPHCGSAGTLVKINKGRQSALENRAKVLELIPKLEQARSQFLEIYTEYQKLQNALASSKHNGNIEASEIPKFVPEKTYMTKRSERSRNRNK